MTRRRTAFPVVVLVGMAVCLLFSGCRRPGGDPIWNNTAKPRVVASIVPLYCFAAEVAGPDAEVRCLLIAKGPHEFTPGNFDVQLLSSADLFITNGLRLENFLDKLVKNSGNSKMTIVHTGERIPQDRRIFTEAQHHGDHSHPAGDDPHVWLGVDEAKIQTDAIRDALSEIDPAHANNYRQRAEQFKEKLDALKTKAAPLRDLPGGLVTFHDSFRYFGRAFGIPIAGAIRGLQGEEIGPAELKRQAQELREKHVRIIGVEPQYPSKAALELARAVDPDERLIQIVDLDPLETGVPTSGRDYVLDKNWYLEKMNQNLDRLIDAKAKLQP